MTDLEQAIYEALQEGSLGGAWIDLNGDGKLCSIDGMFDLSKVAEVLSLKLRETLSDE